MFAIYIHKMPRGKKAVEKVEPVKSSKSYKSAKKVIEEVKGAVASK